MEIFIDCNYCDIEYLKNAIPFINIVREKEAADVHLLFNRVPTGGSGHEYTIIAYGDNGFDNLIDTTIFFTDPIDTYDNTREKIASGIKSSLIPYLIDTPLKTKINYQIEGKQKQNQSQNDPWNNWVFRIRLSNYFNQEESNHSLQIYSSLAAKRVTQEWKFLFNYSNHYRENFFDYEDEDVLNIYRTQLFRTFAIKSLDDHWSLGIWGKLKSSSYSNIELSGSIAPGIEYNIFPYSDYTSRQFRIEYKWEFRNVNYIQETIYFKEQENTIRQSIFFGFDLIKPWGNVGVNLKGSHFLHDISLYSVDFSSRFSFNLIRGLSIDFYGYASAIHDQINLPIDNASLEEVLLQKRELATQFRFSGSLGFSYFFGSIFNNVVNPRFGD